MQPLDGKKTCQYTTLLNHVGLWIDDLPKAVDLARTSNSRRAASARSAAGFDITFSILRATKNSPSAVRRRADRTGPVHRRSRRSVKLVLTATGRTSFPAPPQAGKTNTMR